jgi:hypothetical protein
LWGFSARGIFVVKWTMHWAIFNDLQPDAWINLSC